MLFRSPAPVQAGALTMTGRTMLTPTYLDVTMVPNGDGDKIWTATETNGPRTGIDGANIKVGNQQAHKGTNGQ